VTRHSAQHRNSLSLVANSRLNQSPCTGFATNQHRLSALTQAVFFIKSDCAESEISLKVYMRCDAPNFNQLP